MQLMETRGFDHTHAFKEGLRDEALHRSQIGDFSIALTHKGGDRVNEVDNELGMRGVSKTVRGHNLDPFCKLRHNCFPFRPERIVLRGAGL